MPTLPRAQAPNAPALQARRVCAPLGVLDALRDMEGLAHQVGDAMTTRSFRGDWLVDAFVDAWNDRREEIMDAERRLIVAMRRDVGPHEGEWPQD
jgi:hypothetical protein